MFAVIAGGIAGVLIRWVCLAIFGTQVGIVVLAAAVGALPVCLLAFIGFL
jgi:hypothetical protein